MTSTRNDLVPIDVVARRLKINASAIRYYEVRGLVAPTTRRGGRRWYDSAAVRRIAIIRFWQVNGLMSLDEIGRLLDRSASSSGWPQLLARHSDRISAQIARLAEAKEFLDHIATHHPDAPPDGCAHYESLLESSDACPRPADPHGGGYT